MSAAVLHGSKAHGLSRAFVKPVIFVLMLLPVCYLVWAAAFEHLGANPAQALVRATGDWSLRSLCLVLAVSPLRVMTGSAWLAKLRRMLGLFVYFYVLLHLFSYSFFDMGWDFSSIAKDIGKRPFILVGFSAFVLLTALASTSFNRVIKMLGAKNWQRLHRSVYVVAGLVILHFFWMRAGKNDFADVALYGGVLLSLMGWRLLNYAKKKHQNS